jgi:hypothetical protein
MIDWATIKEYLEGAGLLGATFMGVLYGVRKIYNIARTVDKVLEHAVNDKVDRDRLSVELSTHIKMEDERDKIRDAQFSQMSYDLKAITKEVTPNGGSSMKDVINQTNERVHDIHTRVSILETKEAMKNA